MKTSVKNLSDTKVELTITVGKPELDAAEQVALTKLAKTVKAPGFRKGKVPLAVARKHVDPKALAEQTLEDALSKAVADAFIAEKIQVLERPAVEIKKYVPGQSLEFSAEAATLPKVKLGNYKKLKAKKVIAKVEASDIDAVIERLKSGFADKKEVSRAAKNGDEATIDFVGKKDGVAFDGGTGNDYPLELGSNSFIPGFEPAIVGKKPGETFDIDLTFPADYHAKDLAGQAVTFTTTLKKLSEVVPPKLDDEFAKKAGPFQTLKELKDDIKRELSAQKDREATEKLKDALVGELVDLSEAPAPDVLVEDQIRSIEQDLQQNLLYQNLTFDQYLEGQSLKDRDAWIEQQVRPAAIKRVQAGLVLAELSKLEKVEATSDELAEHLNRYRQQYANSPETAARFDDPEVQRDVANRLITEKTVDRLVELNAKK